LAGPMFAILTPPRPLGQCGFRRRTDEATEMRE
jgi:hypothetical protein